MTFLYQLKNISLYLVILVFASCVSNAENGGETTADTQTKPKVQQAPSVQSQLADASIEEVKAAMQQTEKELYGDNKDNLEFDRGKAQKLVDTYNVFTSRFPQDPETAGYLFKTAEVLRSLRKFNEAVGVYGTIVKDYADFDKAPHSLFLQGFSHENDLKNLDQAKVCYEDFIKKYPDHELADDVQFSLTNLGKSPEEIIEEFERKREKEEGKK